METLTIVLFIWFVLAILSLINATKEFQRHKEVLNNALENEKSKPIANFILKYSFSFLFIYIIFLALYILAFL